MRSYCWALRQWLSHNAAGAAAVAEVVVAEGAAVAQQWVEAVAR